MTYGKVATTKRSKKLDSSVKEISKDLSSLLEESLEYKVGVRHPDERIDHTILPDGGAWYKDGKLVLVIEAKHQANAGNAIERWYKNNFFCRSINPNVTYVTFATGEGSPIGCVMERILRASHLNHFDNDYSNSYLEKGGNNYYYSEKGFDKTTLVKMIFDIVYAHIDD